MPNSVIFNFHIIPSREHPMLMTEIAHIRDNVSSWQPCLHDIWGALRPRRHESVTCHALLNRWPARIMWNAYLRIIGTRILMKQWAACSSSSALRRSDSCSTTNTVDAKICIKHRQKNVTSRLPNALGALVDWSQIDADKTLTLFYPLYERQSTCIVESLIDWLEFNGIFSTNRLHRAFDKYAAQRMDAATGLERRPM